MHTIVKIAGGLIASIGLIVLVAGGFAMRETAAASWLFVLWGAGTLISGAVLYCFGAIVGHLAAIRNLQRQQLEVLERLERHGAAV